MATTSTSTSTLTQPLMIDTSPFPTSNQTQPLESLPSFAVQLINHLDQGKQFTISISANERALLNQVIHDNPDVFNGLVDDIQSILEDNQIDYHDIPRIISMLSKVYKNPNIARGLRNTDKIKLIRYTLDALLASGLVPLPALETEVIEQVINTSLDLLDTSLGSTYSRCLCCC